MAKNLQSHCLRDLERQGTEGIRNRGDIVEHNLEAHRNNALASALFQNRRSHEKRVLWTEWQFVDSLGTVQSYMNVTVKTRVDGQITDVFFAEGQDVSLE